MKRSVHSWIVFVLFTLAIGLEAHAASVAPIAGYIGTYSSNILRTSEDEQWEYINRPMVGMDIDHRGRSFNAFGHIVAEYFDFTQETAENETYFDISAVAEWNIVEDRFTWALEDYASVTPVVISDPVTPLNVEQRNIFVTGPSFRTRLGSRNQFDWNLRYGRFYYQRSNIDNQRYYSDLGISRQINPTNSLRLGYEITRTIFEEEFYQDYFRQDVVLTFDHVARGATLTTSAGYTYLSEEETNESIDGWLLRIVGAKSVGQRTTLNIIASSALSDTGLSNLSVGVGEVIPDVPVSPGQAFSTPPQSATIDIFRESILRFGIINTNPRLTTGFSIGYVQADYVNDNARDNKRLGADVTFDHPVRVDTILGVDLGVGRQEFPSLDVEGFVDDDARAAANITWRVIRRVDLVFDLSRYVRRSSGVGRDYTETVAEVQLVYRPSGRRERIRRVRGR